MGVHELKTHRETKSVQDQRKAHETKKVLDPPPALSEPQGNFQGLRGAAFTAPVPHTEERDCVSSGSLCWEGLTAEGKVASGRSPACLHSNWGSKGLALPT